MLAALLLALDPESVEISQFARFYALHSLLFWLGAIGIYRLVMAPPAAPLRAVLLGIGTLICFGTALYLQITTLIGLLGVAAWSVVALELASQVLAACQVGHRRRRGRNRARRRSRFCSRAA